MRKLDEQLVALTISIDEWERSIASGCNWSVTCWQLAPGPRRPIATMRAHGARRCPQVIAAAVGGSSGALVGFGLVALDVALLVSRRRGRRRRP